MRQFPTSKLTFTALCLQAILLAPQVQANTTESDIEVITVRGDFRQGSLQKLPGSIAVVSTQDIERQAALHFDDVLPNLVNVNFAAGASRGRFLQVRGIGERSEFVDTINPSVGVLVDGIDYSALGLVSMADAAQLEVFRGPEATRFGANAMAGMINFQSADPVFASEGQVGMTLADYGSWQYNLMLNQQVSDDVVVRLVVDKQQSDGFIRNEYLQQDDTNGIDETTLRGKTRWQLSAELSLDWIINQHEIANGYDAFSLDRNRTTLSDNPGTDKQDVLANALKANYSGFSFADSLTQVSVVNADTDYGYDEDWAYAGIHPDEYASVDRYLRNRDLRSIEQRFLSKTDQNSESSWVAGIYGSSQDIELVREYTYLSQNFQSELSRDNVALYAERQQELAPDLQLTYGGRVERYRDDYADNSLVVSANDAWMSGAKLSLAYQVTASTQIYALASKGYKVGGVNGEALAEINNPQLTDIADFLKSKANFGSEQLWNAEFGVKGQSADQRLTSRTSAFYMWRDDMQLKAWINQGTKFVGYIDNAASGKNYGVETENRWQWRPDVGLFANFGLLSSEISGFVTKAGVDKTGRAQANAPKFQYSLGGDWQIHDRLQLSLSLAHKAGYFYSDSEDIEADNSTLVNMRLAYEWQQFKVAVWSRNMLDRDIGVRGFYFGNDPRDGYTDHLYEQFAEPRRVGISASYQF
ncbi:MAG: TonB-dependent receptor [Gammaproteobacteria bacterium]|nr:TonB-dependent receptor [Gammaproteobacteria bacterium]